MISLLHRHDPTLHSYLSARSIEPTFYSIRWLTTLLSREFHLPDTIRLWDSLFACTHHANFLRYVCVTMMMAVREEIMVEDFAEILKVSERSERALRKTSSDESCGIAKDGYIHHH